MSQNWKLTHWAIIKNIDVVMAKATMAVRTDSGVNSAVKAETSMHSERV